jgi:hypothetical protein
MRSRTAAALAAKRARGERFTRRAPLGFRFEDGRLVEDASERAALARVRELRSRGLLPRPRGRHPQGRGRLPWRPVACHHPCPRPRPS